MDNYYKAISADPFQANGPQTKVQLSHRVGLTLALLGALALSGSMVNAGDADEAPLQRGQPGKILLEMDLNASVDYGFTTPNEILDELWPTLWNVPYVPDASAMMLSSHGGESNFWVHMNGDVNQQGHYEEVSSIDTSALDVDLSGQATVSLYDKRLTVGTMIGATGYSTPIYGQLIDVVLEDENSDYSAGLTVLVPFGISDSLEEATQSVMKIYSVLTGSSSILSYSAPSTVPETCIEGCQRNRDTDIDLARSDAKICLLACFTGGMFAIAALGPFSLFAAAAIVAAVAACDGGCVLAHKGDLMDAERKYLNCLALCPDAKVRIGDSVFRVVSPI